MFTGGVRGFDPWPYGCGLKFSQEGQTAGVGPCFHLGQPILEFRFFEPQPYFVLFLLRRQKAKTEIS